MLNREQIAYVVGVLWDAGVDRPEGWDQHRTTKRWVKELDGCRDCRTTIWVNECEEDQLDAILYRIEGWLMREGWSLAEHSDGDMDFRADLYGILVDGPDRTTGILRAAWLQLEAEGKIPAGKEWPG